MANSQLTLNQLRRNIARNEIYPRTNCVKRVPVPREYIPWSTEWKGYRPLDYTSPKLTGAVYADPEIGPGFCPDWNKYDGLVNRISYSGNYDFDVDGRPLNPIGRTGIRGRGLLGRWGPNHAADPVVTRWAKKRNQQDSKVLEFLAIQRMDNCKHAIPGGMVDPGEDIEKTLKREFLEEAFDFNSATPEKQKSLNDDFGELFSKGVLIYEGYVDDSRNTDNAWIETRVVTYHIEDGDPLWGRRPKPGSDAGHVEWVTARAGFPLHASHSLFIKMICQLHDVVWKY